MTSAGGERRTAAAWVGAGGRARRLVGARVTDTYELPVGAVVCVQDPKMDEPWCLVASEAKVPTRVLIRYYGKRWGIEAGFRDIKDMRFGMGLSSMHVSRPDRRDRLLLISALAMGAALLRWRPNQSLRRRRGRRQLDPSRRGEERQRVRWPTVLLSSATDGGLPLVLARFVRGLSTHQDSGCLRRLRTAATAAKCHRAPVDSHRVADQMPTGPSMSRRRAPHAASPLPRG